MCVILFPLSPFPFILILMHSRFTQGNLLWLDLESLTREEVQSVIDEFGITHLVAEELLLPSTKPHAEFHDNCIYLVLHFPALRHAHKNREQEIDFVIGKNFLITAHYDPIDQLHRFSKIFEVNSMLDSNKIGDHAGYLFFYMLKKMYGSIEHEIEYISRDLLMIEEHIFIGHEIDMVKAISRSARDLLNLRQTIEPHREVLKSLDEGGVQFFGQDFMPYLRAISNEYYRVHNHVMRHTDSLHELRESNNSLLSTKENETMRVLTIMALLTFPLSLMVAILQIDTVHNPIRGLPYDFWIILGTVVFTGSCMVIYFKHKKWL